MASKLTSGAAITVISPTKSIREVSQPLGAGPHSNVSRLYIRRSLATRAQNNHTYGFAALLPQHTKYERRPAHLLGLVRVGLGNNLVNVF